MSKVNRNAPKLAGGSEARCTRLMWNRTFPDDAACLDYLVTKLYPEGIYCPTCKRVTKHHRENGRPSYECQFCGHHEHPMVGTIFENSATSLKLWFDAIYLMASTRCGISAKQLEREIGVTYKTAWRMFNKIRSLLTQDEAEYFSGTVEADEAYIGGRSKWRHNTDWRKGFIGRPGRDSGMVGVMGIAERGKDGKHGRVSVKTADSIGGRTLMPNIIEKVLPASTVYTDEYHGYQELTKTGYHHERIKHSERVYVSGDVHVQTIEGFWSLVKRGISGVYHGVSTKHLQSYLDEYVFRYNSRDATGLGMVGAFLDRIVKARPGAAS